MTIADKVGLLKQDFDEVYDAGYEKGKSEGGGGGSDDGVLASLIERSITEIEIPYGVESIGGYAFLSCRQLKKITIPNSVKVISGYSLGILAVDTLDIPDSVTEIGSSAIYSCSNLQSIRLGKGLAKIATNNFNDCPMCVMYDFSKCEVVPTLGGAACFSKINANAKILVPAHLYDEWIVATNWSNFADYIEPYYIISEGLEINGAAVVGRGSCTDSVIVIPDGITEIGEGAFVNDQGIDTLVLPKGGASIIYGSLDGSSLKKIVNCNGSVNSFALYGLSIERISFVDSQWGFAALGFSGIQGSPIYDFIKCTSVMYLDAYDLEFVSVGENTKFIVPASLYDDWVSDTNWAYFADYIVAAE
jgi:hypothetical protein